LAPALTFFFDAALQGAQQSYHTFIHSSQNHSARLDHVFASSHLSHSHFSTDIVHCPYSDHKAVCLSSTPATFSRPLFWRFNTSLLSRADLRVVTERIFRSAIPDEWDAYKVLARSTGRDYAVRASRARNFELCQLRRQLSRAEATARSHRQALHTDPGVLHARQALRQYTDTAAGRSILRARVQWLEEGERCTQYFFNRHRHRSNTSSIDDVRNDHDLPFSSTQERHDYTRSFFSNLYTAPTLDMAASHSFLHPLDLPTLLPEDLDALSTPSRPRNLPMQSTPFRCASLPGPMGYHTSGIKPTSRFSLAHCWTCLMAS
jgi:hypothetical protein